MASLTLDNIKDAIHDRIAGGYPEGIGSISDGYHTFDELYEHRIVLFITTCKGVNGVLSLSGQKNKTWKSKLHSDGTSISGWFIAGINSEPGQQITYHIPMSYWEDWPANEREKAPEWDGHTSADVLKRLKEL